jgi:tRNA 5-methylaminomethyl-2-thiouridine biosynthesis bifunctional protein
MSGSPDKALAWAGRSAWTVLDTAIFELDAFLETWLFWRNAEMRPRMLHYVGMGSFEEYTRFLSDASDQINTPFRLEVLNTLQDACADLTPGIHRILLDYGQLSLTLCIGDPTMMLDAQNIQADQVCLGANFAKWNAREREALGRCCKPTALPSELIALRPRTRSLKNLTLAHTTPKRCAVIGAGISGASIANALAKRGWTVQVLDSHATPAAGASGLPAGLVVPQPTVDDSTSSKILRRACHLMLQHLRAALVSGHDFNDGGVLQQSPDVIFHSNAAWLKPEKMVRAWLKHPLIEFKGNAEVAALERENGAWTLLNAQGKTLAIADIVVIANAMGVSTLKFNGNSRASLADASIQNIESLHPVHGTLSFGKLPHDFEPNSHWPTQPVNGNGSFLPCVPGSRNLWMAGSTFEPGPQAQDPTPERQHLENWDRLHQLLPLVADDLEPQFAKGQVEHWQNIRCVSHDRLPLVGPLEAGPDATLWASVGMGARGLTLTALCAQLLVARLCGEPLPIEKTLARKLDSQRVRRKKHSVKETP